MSYNLEEYLPKELIQEEEKKAQERTELEEINNEKIKKLIKRSKSKSEPVIKEKKKFKNNESQFDEFIDLLQNEKGLLSVKELWDKYFHDSNYSLSTFYNFCRLRNINVRRRLIRYNPGEREFIIRAEAEGVPIKEIAEKTGRTADTIYSFLSKHRRSGK